VTLGTVREAVETGSGTLVGTIGLSGGSLGYGVPVCRDADFVLHVALTRNPVLDFYPAGLEAAVSEGLVSGRGLIFAEVLVFIALLAGGFAYAWRKGVFEWR